MSGQRFELKTVGQTNAYKERIQKEYNAAKFHQLECCRYNEEVKKLTGGQVEPGNWVDSGKYKRPGSVRSEGSVSSSQYSAYWQDMNTRLVKLEQTIAEERTGRQQVQSQLDSIKELLERRLGKD